MTSEEKEYYWKYRALMLALELEINSLERQIKESEAKYHGELNGNIIAIYERGKRDTQKVTVDMLKRWRNS